MTQLLVERNSFCGYNIFVRRPNTARRRRNFHSNAYKRELKDTLRVLFLDSLCSVRNAISHPTVDKFDQNLVHLTAEIWQVRGNLSQGEEEQEDDDYQKLHVHHLLVLLFLNCLGTQVR